MTNEELLGEIRSDLKSHFERVADMFEHQGVQLHHLGEGQERLTDEVSLLAGRLKRVEASLYGVEHRLDERDREYLDHERRINQLEGV